MLSKLPFPAPVMRDGVNNEMHSRVREKQVQCILFLGDNAHPFSLCGGSDAIQSRERGTLLFVDGIQFPFYT